MFHRLQSSVSHGLLRAWLCALLLFSATATAQTESAKQLFSDYWQDLLQLYPERAISQGDYSNAGVFDRSLEDSWRTEVIALADKYLERLAGLDRAGLSDSERVSVDMLSWRLQRDRDYYASEVFETARMLPIDHFNGKHMRFAEAAAGSGNFPFETVEHYELALQRSDGFARWIDQVIARLEEGQARGVVLSRMIVERLLPQLTLHQGLAPEDTQFWKPVANMPESVASAAGDRLRAAYREKIAEVIQPAYEKLHSYLAQRYLPKSQTHVGLVAIPGGSDLYAHHVRVHTTTDMSAEEIHALGRAEVLRILDGFRALQKEVGIEGDLHALFEYARTAPELQYADDERDQIVPDFMARRDDLYKVLPKLFERMPKAAYEIRSLPESARASQGNGYFSAASADGTRPGILWINIWAPGITSRFNLTTLSLHEGLPGHHFQSAIAREIGDLPEFRRFDHTTAFGEGWGLYAESLGEELGVFGDPWQRYGYLNYEIMRANRLVIDTGIHALNWSIDDGVRWMVENSSMSDEQARAEVERYAAYPGQALAYKIGELKLQELRKRAETTLGERFDIRRFHTAVLDLGSVPMAVLEQAIDRWIAAEQAEQSPLAAMFRWWNKAYLQADGFSEAAFAQHFTDDAAILINGVERARGLDGLTEHFQRIQRVTDSVVLSVPFDEEFASADGSRIFTQHRVLTLADGEQSEAALMGYAIVADGKLAHIHFTSANKTLR